MRHFLLFALLPALSLLLGINAQTLDSNMTVSMPPEGVSIATGESRQIEVPFVIDKHHSSNNGVKLSKVSGRQFTIEGVSAGTTVVTVSSAGVEKQFNVTVTSALMPIYRELTRELGALSEVTVEITGDVLALRGEISRVDHWEYFQLVVKRYDKVCRNYVTFRAGTELYSQLTEALNAAGYTVAESVSPERPNEVKIQINNGVLVLSGYLLCNNDIEVINKILAAQKWLEPEWNGGSLRAETQLQVADTQLDVGIVFVGLTRTQLERFGNASADGTVLSWNVISWFRGFTRNVADGVSPNNSATGVYSNFNSNLKGTLNFFGSNGVSDFRDAGHVTLTNNGPNFATYENGGTLSVKLVGSETADLKEIEFGMKLKVRGGLVRSDLVKLELEIEKSMAPVKQDDDYFQRSTKSKAEILCPLDKTAVMAGEREMTYSNSGPSGYAFLRHIPLVNWFFSSKEEQGEEMQMLILICPQLVNHTPQMTSKPSEETANVEKEVAKTVNKQSADAHKKEERNWFLKMFTW